MKGSVPIRTSNTVTVIDPATHKVVDKFGVSHGPQHIVPSWDKKTLWVANTANQTKEGSVTPIDPITGKPVKQFPINDPYNIYFTPMAHQPSLWPKHITSFNCMIRKRLN